MTAAQPESPPSQRCPAKCWFVAGIGAGFLAALSVVTRSHGDTPPPLPAAEAERLAAALPQPAPVPPQQRLPTPPPPAKGELYAAEWGLPVWKQPEIRWTEAARIADPKRPQRPALFTNLTLGLLRTVLPDAAVFWARNPWGTVRVHVAELSVGAPKEWRKHVQQWLPIGEAAPSLAFDFAVAVRFSGLKADTQHGYAIQFSVNGTWMHHADGTFRTFPEAGSLIPADAPLLFGFGSCINPTDRGPTGKSLQLLANWDPALRFFFFIGDFIYFWDELPHETPEYLRYYYRKMATAEVLAAMRATPFFFQYDDHEVHNDYASGGDPSKHQWHRPAMLAWDSLIAQANPRPPRDLVDIPAAEREFHRWYTVSYGNAHFFVADVRSFKVNKKDLTGGLLGKVQLEALRRWMAGTCVRKKLAWCFLVSPTIFSHGSYRTDLWYGHMREQETVRRWMQLPGTAPVTVLSGDSHIPGIWEVAGPLGLEYTCSPVDAFGLMYPWQMPPQYAPKPKKGKRRRQQDEEWPALGNLPPPKSLYVGHPRHLGPAGFNCLVQVNTTRGDGKGRVEMRMDLIDGHQDGGKLLFTHTIGYEHSL